MNLNDQNFHRIDGRNVSGIVAGFCLKQPKTELVDWGGGTGDDQRQPDGTKQQSHEWTTTGGANLQHKKGKKTKI